MKFQKDDYLFFRAKDGNVIFGVGELKSYKWMKWKANLLNNLLTFAFKSKKAYGQHFKQKIMAITGKIHLDWEISEDGQSFFVTGRATKEDGSLVEAETEIGIDLDIEALNLYEGLYELCQMVFEEDIEECKCKRALDKSLYERLKKLDEIEDEFNEDDELMEEFFEINQLNNLIEDLENFEDKL